MVGFTPFRRSGNRWAATAGMAAAEKYIGGRGALILVMRARELVHVAYTGRRRLRRALARMWQSAPVSGGRSRGWTARADDLVVVERCHDVRSAHAIAKRVRAQLSRKK